MRCRRLWAEQDTLVWDLKALETKRDSWCQEQDAARSSCDAKVVAAYACSHVWGNLEADLATCTQLQQAVSAEQVEMVLTVAVLRKSARRNQDNIRTAGRVCFAVDAAEQVYRALAQDAQVHSAKLVKIKKEHLEDIRGLAQQHDEQDGVHRQRCIALVSAGQRWPATHWLATVRFLTPVSFWPGFGSWPGVMTWPGMVSQLILATLPFLLQVFDCRHSPWTEQVCSYCITQCITTCTCRRMKHYAVCKK
jgi:uncharacterized protein with FMN-binding domain